MIEFGVQYRQPMAIYMAEKMAMMTGQVIPHHLAIRVSDMLSHSRDIEEKLINECKVCLSLIGPIKRETIYDSDKIYQHITFRPIFQTMTSRYNKSIRERLSDLLVSHHYSPSLNSEPREIDRKVKKGLIY